MKPIVFADDEWYFHDKLTRSFKSRFPDVPVEAAWSGEELVQKVSSKEYGVIITDYNMGTNQNGIEAAQTIRNKGIKTPIFVYSSKQMPLEVLSGKPADKAFEKESDFEKLLDEVAQVYQSKE